MADETTLRAYLDEAGAVYEIIEVDGTARTAQEAATALGAPLAAIVKSLVCVADGRPVLALVPGDRTLSLQRLAHLLGATDARLASGRVVARVTGYPVGGVAPVAHAVPLPVFAENAMRRFTEVFCGAGSVRHMLRISPDDLGRLSRATWTGLSG